MKHLQILGILLAVYTPFWLLAWAATGNYWYMALSWPMSVVGCWIVAWVTEGLLSRT